MEMKTHRFTHYLQFQVHDTDFNAYKDKRKALDHMRNLALTDFDENKKVQKTRKKCLKS